MDAKPSTTSPDPFEIVQLYKFLRVTDVSDGMDGYGYFSRGLMDPAIRPLWLGMKFWGVAFTLRCVPARRPMWPLNDPEKILDAHGIWFHEIGKHSWQQGVKAGHVIITDSGGTPECGLWGSENTMGMMERGAAGIVTDGHCRDTAEVALQKTPVCARARGRTIVPGRIEVIESQVTIGCGGVQVQPGDIVGCDDDGVIAVPLELAEKVALAARMILLKDMRDREKHYARLGLPRDSTIDYETAEKYYASLR
ncbi:MAG: RraA family protein [Candidatus Sumerlaeota bacterium]|nr:RraA family protein [Candidatus Sumerlaeota bacterium]